jgi:hypothetical protein
VSPSFEFETDLEHLDGTGYAPDAWNLRFTWKVLGQGVEHPRETFAHRRDAAPARSHASWVLGQEGESSAVAVERIELQAPGSQEWTVIHDPAAGVLLERPALGTGGLWAG